MMASDSEGGRSGPGLFTGLGGHMAPGMGGPPGSGLGQLSPYLSVDPSYLQQPEYLFDTEAKRGKLEKSFTAIGSAVCIGSAMGGSYGLFNGMRATAAMHGALRRTQIMNYTLKSGGLVSNAFGTVAVSYSLLHCLLANVPVIEDNDEAKSVISGTLTGLFFKSTSGAQKCARGGLIGFGLSALWALGLKKQESVQNYI